MKRKTLAVLGILALLVSLVVAVPTSAQRPMAGKGDTKSYIVLMAADPAIAYEGDIKGLPATKPGKDGKINPNSAHVKKYVQFLEKEHNKALKGAGANVADKVHDYVYAANGFSAILTAVEAAELAKQPGVVRVMPDEMRYPDTDSTPDFLGLTAPGGAWLTGYTGEDVVVGVLDTGIWPEHPSFADDGTYAPLADYAGLPCEFGNTAHNPDDAPFECNNKLLGARQMLGTYRYYIGAEPYEYDSARDDCGHGTHTSSTAAGNAGVEASIYGIPRGTISGIAPRARVVMYKVCGELGCYSSDSTAAVDQAVVDGVDVINFSIGGGAAGPSAEEIAFLFADVAGVFVATSAGNSGPGAATVGNPGTMPWITTVGANTQSRFFQGTVVLGDGSQYYGASITAGTGELPLVDAEFAGGDLCVPGTLDPGVVAGKIVLCRRGDIARADKSRAVWMAGGAGMIMYENSDDNNLYSDTHWVPSVHIDQTPGLAIKAYVAADPNPTAQILGGEVSEWPYAPSMTYFSSRGPNPVAADIIKPDITAPGIQILAGFSPTPYEAYDLPGQYFAAIAGTSMSSPIVAGVFALIKQAHPDWSAAMAKSAIMTTAYQDVRDNDRMSMADPFDFGAGHVNPGGDAEALGSMFNPGIVYDAGLYEYAAFTCGMEWGVFTPGSCVFLESIGVPMEPYNLNYPSIGVAELPGSQTIYRTVTNVSQSALHLVPIVEAPEGYSVEVSPSVLVVPVGRPATYMVKITNVSAPAGEWRFGSLTWVSDTSNAPKKQGVSAYSPIAVRGALFSAPATVTGSGETGSTSFDVLFGYTGDYTAAPHGLAAQVTTSGLAGQDPDQTYPSADDAPPGVQKFDFPIAGAAYARWDLVIPGPDDIDLFLEDSSGNIIASSTAGGTNELIELWLPADDTYTMVVHGWSVPNEPLPFDLYSWVVPLASGGSLVIDSAPTSATAGTVGTIDLSWSGVSAGTRSYGLVSHADGSGLMGFTLVEIQN
jgi:subtilisin family serine protease